MLYVAPIVEGHGEVESLPALLHRIAADVGVQGRLVVNQPIRVKAGSFLKDEEYFRRHVQLAAAKAAQFDGCVFILLDCEDDCPADLGPALLRKAVAVRRDVRVVVFLAQREYETWFVASIHSLQGHGGIELDVRPPSDPSSIRGAKEWLGSYMNVPYDPIMHQLQFTRVFDLAAARTVHCFNRLYGKVSWLLSAEL